MLHLSYFVIILHILSIFINHCAMHKILHLTFYVNNDVAFVLEEKEIFAEAGLH